jgi:endonuclease-3
LHTVLARRFGERHPNKRRSKREILDTVVGTILSQNTTNINSHRAFELLTERFPTWDAVRTAKPAAVIASIKCGGLAPTKTKRIQAVLKALHRERGVTSMEHLRKETKEGVHAELEKFIGIGKKTAAIINLFDVGHPDMAVDTHVFRYAVQLGWVPSEKERKLHNRKSGEKPWPVVTRDSVYAHLDSRFPDRLKYSMHLILTDTTGGLPVVCGAGEVLSFDGKKIRIDGKPRQKE